MITEELLLAIAAATAAHSRQLLAWAKDTDDVIDPSPESTSCQSVEEIEMDAVVSNPPAADYSLSHPFAHRGGNSPTDRPLTWRRPPVLPRPERPHPASTRVDHGVPNTHRQEIPRG